MSGYPCSSPGCKKPAIWVVLSEVRREADPSEWGIWNYAGTLACDRHRSRAEDEAVASGKHYRLAAIVDPDVLLRRAAD